MNNYKLGFTFITKNIASTRDGLIPRGTNAEVIEISDEEHNGEEFEPYKVIFDTKTIIYGEEVNATDWFTENEMNNLIGR